MLTVKDVAERLKISTSRVRQLLITKRITGTKFGKAWCVSEESLRKFIANGKH